MTRHRASIRTCLFTFAFLGAATAARAAPQTAQPPRTADVLVDPGETKLVLTPTARTLGRGRVSISLLGALPLVQVGITDRVSVGIGVFPFQVDSGRPPVLIAPKWRIVATARADVTIGTLHLAGLGGSSIGLGYVVLTHGRTDNAFTAGLAVLYARTAENGGAAPAAIIGYERRLGERTKIVADSYVYDGGAMASFAIRFVRRHLSSDVGLTVLPFEDDMVPFPSLTFVWRF